MSSEIQSTSSILSSSSDPVTYTSSAMHGEHASSTARTASLALLASATAAYTSDSINSEYVSAPASASGGNRWSTGVNLIFSQVEARLSRKASFLPHRGCTRPKALTVAGTIISVFTRAPGTAPSSRRIWSAIQRLLLLASDRSVEEHLAARHLVCRLHARSIMIITSTGSDSRHGGGSSSRHGGGSSSPSPGPAGGLLSIPATAVATGFGVIC